MRAHIFSYFYVSYIYTCGTVRLYIEFFDGTDADWFDKKDEDVEWRECRNEKGHVRSKALSTMMVQEKRKRRRENKLSVNDDSKNLKIGNGVKVLQQRGPTKREWKDQITFEGTPSVSESVVSYAGSLEGCTHSRGMSNEIRNPGGNPDGRLLVTMSLRCGPIKLEGSTGDVKSVLEN